ncbi:MAG TPA: energy transducer TonB [Thermoanaerobaculia bacterium]|jgi:protein TonB|nr:energy transducer TonB [Thermoanaerobaculia bacterium]
MDPAVDQVLAERERLARSGLAVVSLFAAAGLHVVIGAVLILLPRLVPPPAPLEYVAVQVVPAQRLGAEHPTAAIVPAAPKPQPPPKDEEPPVPPRSNQAPVLPPPKPVKPAKPEKPKPAPPDNRVDPTTLPKVLSPPREVLAKKLGPAAAAPQAQAGLSGAATGTVTGKAPVGSLTVSLENQDFTYNYYIAQTQSRIEQNWTRSPVGQAHARISFRIHSDGSISDLSVAESSGFDTFDLAALRAVQNAAPFPPLPRAYTASHDSVTVNWIAN